MAQAVALKDPQRLYLDWERAFDALGVDDGALARFGLETLNRRLSIIVVSLEAAD